MKNVVCFLLGALLATGFWFYMGYLQVDGDKLEKYLHHDAKEKDVMSDEEIAELLAELDALAEESEQKIEKVPSKQESSSPKKKETVKSVEKTAKKTEEKPAGKTVEQTPTKQTEPKASTSTASAEPEHVTQSVSQPVATEPEPKQTTQPSIVGRWRLPNPVGYSEQNKMLSFDEYGTFKDYYSTSSGLSCDYTYILQNDVLKYKDKYSRTYDKSFRFKVSTVNGKDYLEIFDSAEFGGKWVRSK